MVHIANDLNKSIYFVYVQVYWTYMRRAMVISSDDTINLEDIFNPIIDGNYKYDVIKSEFGDRTTYRLIIRRLEFTDGGIV